MCRKCHIGPLKPKKPNRHLFKTTAQTSGPIYHLRDLFGSRQSSITGFISSSTGARNSDTPFD